MHQCLLVSEIFHTILEFTQQYDEGDGCKRDRKLGKHALASLAQTCRTFSSPALDRLWMRLDNLDPLIKLLPRRTWERKSLFIVVLVRMLMNKDRWLSFRKYAPRVQFLSSPFHSISPWVQHNVVTALALFPGASRPLLPNLKEIVWIESNVFVRSIPLIKYFVGPGVTSLSFSLPYGRMSTSTRAVLLNLPNLCPNLTSFAFVASCYLVPEDVSSCIGDIVTRLPNLEVLQTVPLCYCDMIKVVSNRTLKSLSLDTTYFTSCYHVGKLPDRIHTLWVHAYDPTFCISTLHGSLTCFHLRLPGYRVSQSEVDSLFDILPTRFNNARLRTLTIKPTNLKKPWMRLMENNLTSLYAFSALRTLDLSSFRTSDLDNAVYVRMAASWPELTTLKLGTAVAPPFLSDFRASVGAVIALLRSCPHLKTLHIVFNGSTPPPQPVTVTDVDWEGQHKVSARDAEEDTEVVEEIEEEKAAVGQANGWGVSNWHITQLHVGCSPIQEDTDRFKELASCLRSVMPRLETIRSEKELSNMAERWATVQRLLAGDDAPPLRDQPT